MQCLQCQHENSAATKFCEECGTRLVRGCPSCGHELRPTAKFCGECGTALTSKSKIKRQKSKACPERSRRGKSENSKLETRNSKLIAGERRQLTVMFCDLVGSTALSEQLDPEELRAVVRAYQQVSAEVIGRFDGHIAQYLGDGILVYFGYPVAHEDDAARAVRAGLEIIAAMRGQVTGNRLQGGQQPLPVRIGIHTGLVVVGEMGGGEKRELLALGETPNLAARIQGQAEPDTVLISAATYRLVEGLFDCEDRGQPTLKGVSTPLMLYRVLKAGEAQSRFQVVARKGLTPLVGREHEFGLLREHWERVKDGTGQVVLLSGEPGIGKSRLVEALKEAVEHEGARCLELRCSPYHQNSALYPITDHLQRLLQFTAEETSDARLEKLQQRLRHYRFPQSETLPLLAVLLSLPLPAGVPPLTLSPQKQKEKTLDALVSWLVEEAERAPLSCAWEDLHWADPSTLEVLTLLLDQVPTTRMLVLLTFRPEFVPPWGTRAHLSQLTLSRLGRSQVEEMVDHVVAQTLRPLRLGSGQASTSSGRTESELSGERFPVRAEPVEARMALSSEVLQQIVVKTDGVPLFVEELTKTVLESVESIGSVESIESIGSIESVGSRGARSHTFPPLGIPATLQDALMARLDRLGAAKEIAQVGATIGREFHYVLLQAVSPLTEETLQQGLRQLVEAELVYQSGRPPQAHYLFKHALIQDTAYQSLLKSRRQQLHQQIAQVLVERFPEIVETQPELIAHHHTEAGLIARALPYWQRAGERASQRSAYVEAISHLTKGLELLKTLSDTPERASQELTLQIALGAALVAVKGYAAPEVEKIYTRARELCRQLGETPQLVPILRSLVVFYNNQGEFQTARELAELLLRLAQSVQDQKLLISAHGILGWTLWFLGELTSAWIHVEQGIALSDPQEHPRPVNTDDPRMHCLSFAGRTLWSLGYPDQALKRSQEALALAEGLSHPFSLASVLGNVAPVHLLRREEQLARERAEAVITLATEQGFPYWLAGGTIVRGWALAEQGQVEEGIAQMRQGLAAFRAMGTEVGRPRWLALLAEAHGKVERVEEGLALLAEALAFVDKTGERVHEAELYRLKGELLLAQEIKNQKPVLSVVEGSRSKSQKSEPPSTQHLTPSTQEAEACFQKAIEISQKQQAKSLELRATMSLARLWQQQGKITEAHQMLAEIYDWFTEGFDTKDLQEAKALLDELEK